MKQIKNILPLLLLACILSVESLAQVPNSAYTIQQSDWLSKISTEAYGNPHLYYRIIEGTNQRAKSDNSFKAIESANDIKVGQKIWIPHLPSSTNLIDIPNTDCDIRLWYNYQVIAIGVINQKWEQDGIDLATRAKKAYEMRHEARVNARFMMEDKEAVKALQDRDTQKYGNPDGPTFEYLLNKNTDKGLSLEEAYQLIIDSSSRTDRHYNADCL